MTWTAPATYTVGEIVTAAKLNANIRDNMGEVWHEVAYVEFVADVSINNIAEATPTDIVSAGAVTYNGNPIIVELYCPSLRFTASTGAINLWEDTTDKGRVVDGRAAVAQMQGGFWMRRYSPASGSKTLKFRGWSGNNSPGLVIGAGAGGVGTDMPGFIRVLQKG